MVAAAFGIAAIVFLALAVCSALDVVAVSIGLMVVLAIVCAVVFAALSGRFNARL